MSQADIAVIGGGLIGLLTAAESTERGVSGAKTLFTPQAHAELQAERSFDTPHHSF